MLSFVTSTVTSVRANLWLAMLLYWLPLLVSAWYYVLKFVNMYHKDHTQRRKCELGENYTYIPELKVAHLIFGVFMIFTPGANLVGTVFHHIWVLFSDFFDVLKALFDVPLVPRRPSKEPNRETR